MKRKIKVTLEQAVEKVLPCPFCGEKPKITEDRRYFEMVVNCCNESCGVEPVTFSTPRRVYGKDNHVVDYIYDYEEVLKKWNTRA
jgi:transcription elongation factor Elf1